MVDARDILEDPAVRIADLAESALFPTFQNVRDISHAIACAVVRRGVREGRAVERRRVHARAAPEPLGCREPIRRPFYRTPWSLIMREAVIVSTARTGIGPRKRRKFTATHVVLAAGTFGTQKLLFKMRDKGKLPKLATREDVDEVIVSTLPRRLSRCHDNRSARRVTHRTRIPGWQYDTASAGNDRRIRRRPSSS